MAAINYTFTDLKKSLLRFCGELDDGNSAYDAASGTNLALDYLSKAYLAVLSGASEFGLEVSEPWPWALEPNPGTLVLQPYLSAGSVAVTQNSATITFSSPPAVSVAGWHFKIDDVAEVYKIKTHTAGQAAAVLEAVYTDLTNTSKTYRVFQIEYVLQPHVNGILRMVQPMMVYRPQTARGDDEGQIYFMDKEVMLRQYPTHRIEIGVPTQFSIVYRNEASGAVTVRFNKYVDQLTKIDFDYIKVPDVPLDNSADAPIIPVAHREVLAYIGAYKLLQDKSDDKAQEYFKLSQTRLVAMFKESQRQKTQMSKQRGELIPRLDLLARDRPYLIVEDRGV